VVLMSQIGTKDVEIFLKDFLFVYSNDHVPKFRFHTMNSVLYQWLNMHISL
jgi:hypothetical protein